MLNMIFLLPLADFKTIKVPASQSATAVTEGLLSTAGGLALIVLLFGLVFVGLWLGGAFGKRPDEPAKPAKPENWIVVDGSNVMHWKDNKPELAPLLHVLEDLKARGFAPGVVFDANAGWKLFGKYLNEQELSRMLHLPQNQLLVVPKGTPADPYIIETALKFEAPIVTNDRFRDWAETYPKVTEPGFLIGGGIKDGEVWLRYPNLSPDMQAKTAAAAR